MPPYIRRSSANELERDRERYQTVFAEAAGSVAAPTAGLHITGSFLESARSRGVQVCFLTLHVGAGTFAPVKTENIAAHRMHAERYELPEASARVINNAKRTGNRVFAVGTTTLRVFESVAAKTVRLDLSVESVRSARTDIFIYPPYHFKVVDALVTNFHLPCSTLLMLASAFVTPGETRGRDIILAAYAEAIRERYRFFSYGDAMLIL